MTIAEFRELLNSRDRNAPIESADLDGPLAEIWQHLDGSSGSGMEAYKLLGRMENIRWEPPVLSFVIERHGGTVLGSTRAELQEWKVHLDAGTAAITGVGRRQLEPTAPRVRTGETAAEVAMAILNGADDERFKWESDDRTRVTINTSKMFPTGSAANETVAGRRRRLCTDIENILSEHGWIRFSGNRFRKEAP